MNFDGLELPLTFKALFLQEYFQVLPLAGQGRAGPVLEEFLAFLHQNNRFLTTAVVLVAFSSTRWGRACQIPISACPFVFTLCNKYVKKTLKKKYYVSKISSDKRNLFFQRMHAAFFFFFFLLREVRKKLMFKCLMFKFKSCTHLHSS